MSWLKDRRERKAFEQALAAEVAQLKQEIEQTREVFAAGERKVRQLVGRLPGAAPRCEKCGGPVLLERHKWGRGKNQWSSAWNCTRCHHGHRKEVVHGSWEEPDPIGAPFA